MLLLLEIATLATLIYTTQDAQALGLGKCLAAQTQQVLAHLQFFLFFFWLSVFSSFFFFWALGVTFEAWGGFDFVASAALSRHV
jgi:hypothetical protein